MAVLGALSRRRRSRRSNTAAARTTRGRVRVPLGPPGSRTDLVRTLVHAGNGLAGRLERLSDRWSGPDTLYTADARYVEASLLVAASGAGTLRGSSPVLWLTRLTRTRRSNRLLLPEARGLPIGRGHGRARSQAYWERWIAYGTRPAGRCPNDSATSSCHRSSAANARSTRTRGRDPTSVHPRTPASADGGTSGQCPFPRSWLCVAQAWLWRAACCRAASLTSRRPASFAVDRSGRRRLSRRTSPGRAARPRRSTRCPGSLRRAGQHRCLRRCR
jgi:hypothetical protein